MRFDTKGRKRADFILNRPEYAQTRVLVAGSNFGCGPSREHAVWGLQQFGIQAVIASSFAEIFHANAMNNRLLLVVLSEAQVQAIMADASQSSRSEEPTSELQSLMRISYAVFCLKKKKHLHNNT